MLTVNPDTNNGMYPVAGASCPGAMSGKHQVFTAAVNRPQLAVVATDTLDIALAASGCGDARILHKPRLHSDSASSYTAGDLAEYIEDKGMKHVRGAPMLPQTQGKIERWHQTLKNRILLENYFMEGKLEAAIAAFIDHYNCHRYHESVGSLTPADAHFGRGETILAERRRIKHQTIQNRRLNHRHQAA